MKTNMKIFDMDFLISNVFHRGSETAATSLNTFIRFKKRAIFKPFSLEGSPNVGFHMLLVRFGLGARRQMPDVFAYAAFTSYAPTTVTVLTLQVH